MDSPTAELYVAVRKWEEEYGNPNFNPTKTLIKLCNLFEEESKNYLNKEPDPFDNRHPSKIDSNCALGQMYKILFRKDMLMNCLVVDYLKDNHWARRPKDNLELNVAACRLIMSLIPGLETTVVFESPTSHALVNQLFTWAQSDCEPLQTYATGLLAACMDLPKISPNFKGKNNILIPVVLDRLQSYHPQLCEELKNIQSLRPLSFEDDSEPDPEDISISGPKKRKETVCYDQNDSLRFPAGTIKTNWVKIYPLTVTTKIVYCLKYLTSSGEYQEFLSHAYEKNALNLVLKIISPSEYQNGYLTFEALKYLASLLSHKKFATEFIAASGLQKILLIPKPSIPSMGVSVCFYNLSNCEEAMERICLLPNHILNDLVVYALWMLECPHASGRCHATVFFSYSFHYKVIQEIFDSHDGLRKLINVISTLPILTLDDVEYNPLSDDSECAAKQIIRHISTALSQYFEAHLHIKAQQIRRAKMRDSGLLSSSTVSNIFTVPAYKSNKKSQAEVYEEIELLSNAVSMKSHWTPVDNLITLGGLNILLKIISMAHNWNVAERCELVTSALEVLNICAVLPKVQLALCEPAPNVLDDLSYTLMLDEDQQDEYESVGFNIIIKAAEGDRLDVNIQITALYVIITCVCAPIHREGGSIAYFSASGSAKKRPQRTSDDAVIEKVWDCIRNNNGIMVLLNLMTIETPITDSDALRGLASRALAGLARSESVRQILSKLPLFNNGQLQSLMKNPVLQEKRQEHITFQKYALELIVLVCGKTKLNGTKIEASLENIKRANIVAQTKIHYNEQQLLFLMHQHFIAKGLSKTADVLVQEASLNVTDKMSVPVPYVAHCRNRSVGGVSPMNSRRSSQVPNSDLANTSNSLASTSIDRQRINSSFPLRLSLNRRSEVRPNPVPEHESPMSKSVHKTIDQAMPSSSDNNGSSTVSIHSIVTEYFTNQHASCKHPIVTCPQFDLFVPHKCPDPKPRNLLYTNFAMRFSKNIHSRRLDQRLIHGRFCPTQTFQLDNRDDEYFTCCEFICQDHVAVGTYAGGIKIIDLFKPREVPQSYYGHDSYIYNIESSNDGQLLLSSASWRAPLSTLWTVDRDSISKRYSLEHEEYCTFSNRYQNKILGTKAEVATIYDLETRTKLMKLVPKHSNQYIRNRAVFDLTNKLVLSDGVLWDAISKKEIHKFDKLNQVINGIFHPNGFEIVSNTEVWDTRTFKLLRTVPSLDQCSVFFSKPGGGMYAFVTDQESADVANYKTSFNTLDPHDYSSIATIDVKKSIYHMAANSYDTQIAIIENQGVYENSSIESHIRIYDVGRSKTNCENTEELETQDDENVESEDSESDSNMSNFYPSNQEEFIPGRENDISSSNSSDNSSDSSSSTSTSVMSDSSNDTSYYPSANTGAEDDSD